MGKQRKKILTFLVITFFITSFFGFSVYPAHADTASDIKDKIEKLNKKLKEAQQELATEQSQLYKNKAQISITQTLLKEIQADIARSEEELNNLNNRAELNKKILSEYIRQMYYANQDNPVISLAVFDGNMSDLTWGFDSMAGIKTKISDVLQEINDAKGETEEAKALLASQKQKNQKALESQQVQQAAIVDDIEETQSTLAEIQKKMSELQSDLNKLLGGSYDAKDVKDAIKFASKKTGVRAGFLFGMLSVESRLGASVGGCDYKGSKMSSARLTIFKNIAEELDLDYKKLKVSCAPKSYKGTGGAMGAAQFMSDTWWGYKSKIASATGHNPPNPWNLTDGVMAMALKLKNDGATESGKVRITSPCDKKKISVKWEVYASMKYLGWSCYGLTNYSKTIQSLSGNYDKL